MNDDDQQVVLAKLNAWAAQTLLQTLSIQFVAVGEDYLVATMPVGPQVHQPHGILHGGASVALGESVASTLSNWLVMDEGKSAVGVNIQANHLRPMQSGIATCKAVIKRKGRTMHYCEMSVVDEAGRLVCAMSMNNMVLSQR